MKRNYITSIVHSGMDYCSVVWSDNSSSVSRCLQLLEKQSIRVLAGRRRFDRTGDLEELCRQFKISSFTLWHNKQLGNLIFKCINGLALPSISYSFCPVSSLHREYPLTRLSQRGVQVDSPRTNALKSTLFYRGQQLWNSLPLSLRLLHSDMLSIFKSKLHTTLFN